jgi:hypothetical protein
MWTELKRAIRVRWPEVTAADIASLGDERDALMRVLKSRSTTTYAPIYREIADSEAPDWRVGSARRLPPGIGTG